MANHDDAALRQAADRIMAERQRWEGVGLLVLENLDTGACSIALVPAGAPRPDWTDELLRAGGGWDRHEDLNLATWLQRWGAAVGADGTMRRWGEWMNLLHLHLPTALVAAMPAAPRRLACGHGFGVHAAPPMHGASELLGRLVAWLLPWERLAVGDGRQACALWLGPPAVQRQWQATGLAHGAGGCTAAEREAAGGLVEWGVLAAWPSAVDAVVAFLLAQADAPGATPAAQAPAGPGATRRTASKPLNQAEARLVAFAVVVAREPAIARADSQSAQCTSVLKWIEKHGEHHVPADELRTVRYEGLPLGWLDRAAREFPAGCSVAKLARWSTKLSSGQFRSDISKALAASRCSDCSK